MNINETLGKKIKTLRETFHLKQIDIAHALQISPQAVSKWEKGENAPDISLLVPLAKLFGVTTDSLLGYYDNNEKNIEASVFVSSIKGLTSKIQKLSDEESALWMNGFLTQVTEAVLKYDGIPVKYMGGGFLGFFAGPNHQNRSILSSILAKKTVSEDVSIGLHSGNIFLGTIGHKDYASKDISGTTVNIAFRISACASATGINASKKTVHEAQFDRIINLRTENLKGIDEPVEICEIIVNG
ncbi:MAG: helix-turn-helix domain-containing protein [Spirochaetales bacterium]|nr:helix-turn-helix domain-containing protein [Spirochaetales bacterium]